MFRIENSPDKPTAVVFGGAGFIGKNLCRKLLNRGLNVISVDKNPAPEDLGGVTHILADLATFPININQPVEYVFCLIGSSASFQSDLAAIEKILNFCIEKKARLLYLSTVNIYSGVASSRELGNYSGDTVFSRDVHSVQEVKRAAELMISQATSGGLEAVVVRSSEVYGPGMNVRSRGSLIGEIFYQALNNKTIGIYGDGRCEVHPTFVDDLTDGLVTAMLRPAAQGRIYTIVSLPSTSLLELANKIKFFCRSESNLEFLPDDPACHPPFLFKEAQAAQEELGLTFTNDLDSGLSQTAMSLAQTKVVPDQVKVATSPPVNLPAPKKKYWPRWLILLLAVVGTGIILLAVSGFMLVSIKNHSIVPLTPTLASGTVKVASSLREFLAIVGLKSAGDRLYFYATGFRDFSLLINRLIAVYPLVKSLTQLGSPSGQGISSEMVNRLVVELGAIRTDLGFLLARPLVLEKYRPMVEAAYLLSSVASDLDGEVASLLVIGGRAKYLILFQNNAELRPAGGFIGSYALVTLENGRLLDYKISDVYQADGQLKGRVLPPDEILHYLGQPSWFLRDSNWSPDFSLSARRAGWFLEKEIGEKVDGVVGVDLFVVQKLLSLTGPIVLAEFNNETVTAENFFQKAEYHAEINFFPGSTQKSDYLSAVAGAVITKLPRLSDPTAVLMAVSDLITGRHLQFFTLNPSAQMVWQRYNLDGRLGWENLGPDGLAMVEANLGANKANFFVKKSLSVVTDIGKNGEINHAVTAVFRNDSPNDTWPAGRYKDYLRFYVPLGAKLTSVSLGDDREPVISSVLTEAAIKKLDPKQFLVLETIDNGLLSWGFLVEVPVKSSQTVTLKYRSPVGLNLSLAQNKLAFNFRKQAGTDKDNLSYTVNYPLFLTPTDFGNALVSAGSVRYNTDLSVDRKFSVVWKKQP